MMSLLMFAILAAGGNISFALVKQSSRAQLSASVRNAAARLRIALVGLIHADTRIEPAIAESLSHDSRIELIDPSMIKPALVGMRYDGSINMSKDEARRLGAAIGCDFFMIGKGEALTRSERENESHEVAYAGVMVVDGRTGALAAFDFVSERAATREAAVKSLLTTLRTRTARYVDQLIELRRTMSSAPQGSRDSRPLEIIEDLPDQDSPRSTGFVAPGFLNRVKPEITREADLADITATVEIMVVFQSNGEVGAVEITRWAGFGLDESAERAIRQLKFKPATRDGKPVSVRAFIRYNFRRVTDDSAKPEQLVPKPPEKPERDLRQLFKPTYRRP